MTMEKITDKIAALPPGSNFFSLEFFPPKTNMGLSNLRSRLDRMARALRPLFVTVTWGAGGSTSTNSLELADLCQRQLGLTTCLHLTCTNSSQELIHKTLEAARVLGIRNILALRGDPPRKDTEIVNSEIESPAEFEWAIDLVRYIKKNYGDFFCIGVAAYPEGHADGSDPDGQSLESDLPYLIEKVKAGADFIMTQLFFDTGAYDTFEKRLLEHESGCFKNLPIIPGLMPIQSFQMIMRTLKLTHVKMPSDVIAYLTSIKGDDELVKKAGVEIVSKIVSHIQDSPAPPIGRRGFHFYTLNLEKAVSFILEKTSLIRLSHSASVNDNSISNFTNIESSAFPTNPNINNHTDHLGHQQSLIISDSSNTVSNTSPLTSQPQVEVKLSETNSFSNCIENRASTLAISKGGDPLGREAIWDDFPNGRWGDARSPAYGELDGYGINIHLYLNQAIRLWGYPQSTNDITSIFTNYIKGSLGAIPWSDEPICRETDVIKDQLLKLNEKGWWTIASQPVINGIKSNDDVFGWGPRNGFVFQKAFVELFLSSEDLLQLQAKVKKMEMANKISWYACNSKGEFSSSDTLAKSSSNNRGSINAVTWGVFPGKEIVTPTIIEEISFRAWAEEAFKIWAEWGKAYTGSSPTSPDFQKAQASHQLINRLREEVWLVNIIHHGLIEKDGLWDLLIG
ncbi:Methylenetetrahydrofolate reductase 2 [Golovinomyces cichoracearum]|uniref:Methylenetetrahydrofolate reductase 2 n=1 Tax=Golovinomyces cichoracearum TaxID=62708 RepID=A0A420IE02_9PEZI|nr:Methylenetetrahydrofolate reductase 2 [Golovinomyces cichoracearum]